jgi:uncharacterized protein YutE (UPF0331/DUF86 family)
MDPEVISAKLESLARCAVRIRSKLPKGWNELSTDFDAQDIIVLNLERAVQLCVDISAHMLSDLEGPTPQTMADTLRALGVTGIIDRGLADRLARAVGFRNIALHQYRELDWRIVFFIATEGMEDFRIFASAIIAAIEGRHHD